jgi:hypothetical protein
MQSAVGWLRANHTHRRRAPLRVLTAAHSTGSAARRAAGLDQGRAVPRPRAVDSSPNRTAASRRSELPPPRAGRSPRSRWRVFPASLTGSGPAQPFDTDTVGPRPYVAPDHTWPMARPYMVRDRPWCGHVQSCIPSHIYIYIYIYVCVCVCVCMYLYRGVMYPLARIHGVGDRPLCDPGPYMVWCGREGAGRGDEGRRTVVSSFTGNRTVVKTEMGGGERETEGGGEGEGGKDGGTEGGKELQGEREGGKELQGGREGGTARRQTPNVPSS